MHVRLSGTVLRLSPAIWLADRCMTNSLNIQRATGVHLPCPLDGLSLSGRDGARPRCGCFSDSVIPIRPSFYIEISNADAAVLFHCAPRLDERFAYVCHGSHAFPFNYFWGRISGNVNIQSAISANKLVSLNAVERLSWIGAHFSMNVFRRYKSTRRLRERPSKWVLLEAIPSPPRGFPRGKVREHHVYLIAQSVEIFDSGIHFLRRFPNDVVDNIKSAIDGMTRYVSFCYVAGFLVQHISVPPLIFR